MTNKYQILLFYNYTPLEDPKKIFLEQKKLCEELNLKGRIIVAPEGINGTVEGVRKNTEEYIKRLTKNLQFKNTDFKKSEGTGNAFPKLSVKLRDEIVSLSFGEDDIKPYEITGKYLTPEQLHEWIHSDKKFYIVDMRNDYEQAIGYFNNSILPPLKNSRDLPEVLPILESLKNQTVVTVCTGGVRCEKMSGFLLKSGFKDVYQLYGGIVSYMEKYPNEDFLGKLYVFDGRITMGFNLKDPKHQVVGQCSKCLKKAEEYYDCKYLHCPGKRHFISCKGCLKKSQGCCSKDCLNKANSNEELKFQIYTK